MMDWTDRHCRAFHRLLSPHARLYSEMVTADAVIRGDRERLIGFAPQEQPVALQLGGAAPGKLAQAARIGADFGYDEINLNVGCPSDRVQEGRFGACLMAEPALVADCVAAMNAAVTIPVTVKCRIGIDDQDEAAGLDRFVATVADAGCEVFIVHARKAWLKGLSPKENREVPPLNYDRVARLKAANPALTIVINGGIETATAAADHLARVDGVMLGRAAYRTPYVLAEAEAALFGTPLPSRAAVLEQLVPLAERHLAAGGRLPHITRHILGFYHGRPRGARFRRHLSEQASRPGAGLTVLRDAIAIVEDVPVSGGDGAREPAPPLAAA